MGGVCWSVSDSISRLEVQGEIRCLLTHSIKDQQRNFNIRLAAVTQSQRASTSETLNQHSPTE